MRLGEQIPDEDRIRLQTALRINVTDRRGAQYPRSASMARLAEP